MTLHDYDLLPESEIDPLTGKLRTKNSGSQAFVQTGINRNLLYTKSEVDAKVASVSGGATGVSSVNTRTGAVTLTSTDVGLNNVDNTSNATERAATATLTNKRITARITTITSSATPTINTDNCDAVTITAQAVAITSMTTNLSGTPNNFDRLTIRIKDNGTARAITWGASFASRGATLPTTTIISKVLTVGFIYNAVAAVWDCVATAQES